jgi:hypothetical protein
MRGRIAEKYRKNFSLSLYILMMPNVRLFVQFEFPKQDELSFRDSLQVKT